MQTGETTLVLAGAREAHGVVDGLLARGCRVRVCLPEPERGMAPFAVPVRTGRFENRDAMRDWLSAQNTAKVIDASHAFDNDISNAAATLCKAARIPYLRILRPGWQCAAGDRWTRFDSIAQAVDNVPPGARVFSNTGFGSLKHYARFQGDILFLRQTGLASPEPSWPFVQIVEGEPPFSEEQECRLFRELQITGLICRDVGGPASFSKLAAACRLGLEVAMIDRPAPPEGARSVQTVAEALAWAADAVK